MLVLIVVAASIALAAFIASYQKQYQAQQAVSDQRSLEKLDVLDIAKVTPQASRQLDIQNFSFVLASEYIHPSYIASLSINGNPLEYYYVQNITGGGPGLPGCYNDSMQLMINPFAQMEITVNTNLTATTPCPYGFFSSTAAPQVDNFLQISVYTELTNTFTSVFLPPTAIPVVSTISEYIGTGYQNVPVLDGAGSFQTGNGTLTSWSWEVEDTTTLPATYTNVTGEQVVAPFASDSPPGPYTFTITLTVTNSNGLIGVDTFDYVYTP
jgi:hypothetical protein